MTELKAIYRGQWSLFSAGDHNQTMGNHISHRANRTSKLDSSTTVKTDSKVPWSGLQVRIRFINAHGPVNVSCWNVTIDHQQGQSNPNITIKHASNLLIVNLITSVFILVFSVIDKTHEKEF
jgi:hypothetical protein